MRVRFSPPLNRWELLEAPAGAVLTRVLISHEVSPTHSGHQTYYFAGARHVSIHVRHNDGRIEVIEDVGEVGDEFPSKVRR